MNNRYILATDLDGTFLHGSEVEKRQFYDFLRTNRDQFGVIFVTGRTLDLIKDLYATGFDFIPDYIVADHGTVIVHGDDHQPVEPIQSKVKAQWQQSEHEVLLNLLNNEPTISIQPFNPPYRHAYYYQSEIIKDHLLPEIKALGFECIASSGVYLDILPRNFNKGATLLYLLDHLRVDHNNVITAGDTLNDLPLFRTGLPGIVVGNAETNLIPHVASMDNIYLSPYHGVSGIIDGLINYKWLATA